MPDATEEPTPYVLSVLKYLGLPIDYQPSPVTAPAEFLAQHMRTLPQNLLVLFTPHITAKQRTALPVIRNRRLQYFESNPPEFSMPIAKATFSSLWPGPVGNMNDVARHGAKEEQEWADKEFLGGQAKQVGKLGGLLGGYEEEREAERARILRRQQREMEESLPEEDEDSDDEDNGLDGHEEELPPQEAEELLKRRLKERFIYGLLDVRVSPAFYSFLYNSWLSFPIRVLTTSMWIGMRNGILIKIETKKKGGSTKRRKASISPRMGSRMRAIYFVLHASGSAGTSSKEYAVCFVTEIS